MKRPLFICFLSLLSGIILLSLADKLPGLGIIGLSLVLVWGTFDRKNRKNIYIWSMVFFAIGLMVAYFSFSPKSSWAEERANAGAEVSVEGRVISISYTYTGRQKLELKVTKIHAGSEAEKTNIKIQVTLEADQFVSSGSDVVITGILQHLEPTRNPGGYNEKLYLGARKFDYKMYGSLKSEAVNLNIHFVMDKVRSRITECYDTVLPKREAGILKSMILGDKSGIDDYIKDMYREAGIYHILVISGLHISITALVVEWILSHFLNVKKAALASIAFICIYCVFTGAGVSAVRAVIMAVVVIVAKVIYRESDLLSSASFSAILLLIYEPLYAFDIGFQYSFSAVFSIGLLAEPVGTALKRAMNTALTKTENENKEILMISNRICAALGTCLAVFIGTMPVQIYHFNYIYPLSVIVNMIIVPLVPMIVVLGFIIALVGFVSSFSAHVLAGAAYVFLEIYESICIFSENIPISKILVATPNYMLCILFLICIITWAACFEMRLKSHKIAIVGLMVFSVFGVVCAAESLRKEPPTITMLDVGQGDCTVVESGGEVFVIDGGGWYGRELGRNTGAGILVPYLDHKGIGYVDGAFISHLDSDHAMGIIELIYEKPVGVVYLPYTPDLENPLYIALKEACDEKKVPIVHLARGEKIATESAIDFVVLSPSASQDYKDGNESSLVLFMNMDLKYVFAGDIGFDAEEEIVAAFENLDCHVLKVAHHGSKYSTGELFLDTLKPEVAIAGAGVNNNYGHPSVEVESRLGERNIDFYSTKSCGAVIIFNEGGLPSLKTMLEGTVPYMNIFGY